MRVHVLLAVMLVTALVTDTAEAGFFRRIWRGVKRTARKVGTWVSEHCTVGTGIQCRIRFKRAVDLAQLGVSVVDKGNATDTGSPVEDICALVDTTNMPFDGMAKDVLDEFFSLADKDDDKELSAEEFNFFVKTIVVYQQCLPVEPLKAL